MAAAATLIEPNLARTSSDAPPRRLNRRSNGMLMTREEFLAIEDCDRHYRYELVHGIVIVSPPPGMGEASPNDLLGFWIRLFQQNDPGGAIIDDTAQERDIVTSTGVRRADRAVWIGLGRPPQEPDDVPAIVIEFVSSRKRDRRRDYIEKRSEYAEAGIKEYWVVDRFGAQVVIFRGIDEELVLKAGTYRTPLIPGFELSIPALLSACNRYK